MHLCLKLLCAKALCPQRFCCAKKCLCLKELSGLQKSWDELRWTFFSARMRGNSWEELLVRWYVRRDGMRWEELRWGDMRREEIRYYLRWDEVWNVKCKCEAWSAGCEGCSVKCEESVHLALHCHVVARPSCSWMFLDNNRAAGLRKARIHARAWLAHGACKFYRWKKSYFQIEGNFCPASCGYYCYIYVLSCWW